MARTATSSIDERQVPEGFEKTRLGLHPENWKICKIGDCLERVGKPVQVEKERLYTQIGIRSHGKGLFYKEPVTGQALGNKSVFWIQPDCFILNIVFAWEQAIGKTTIKEKGMIGSHRFPMYRPIDQRVDIDYLIYYFLTKRGGDILEAASPGGAGRNKTLGQSRFLESKIVLPPIHEQRRIAEILSAQERLIELKEKLLEQKKRQKKYLMQRLFSMSSEKSINTEKLSSFCSFIGGGTPNTNVKRYWRGDIPWISSSDLSDESLKYIHVVKHISEAALQNSATKKCPPGCILVVNRVGVGKVAVAHQELCTSQDFVNIVQHKHDNEYLAYALRWILKSKATLAQGSAIKGIPANEIKQYELFFPSRTEQHVIVNILSTAEREIGLLQKDIDAERLKKKALVQLLLTGIVRVEGASSAGAPPRGRRQAELLASGEK